MSGALVFSFLLAAAAADSHCTSRRSCSQCTAPPPENEAPCFWCHDSAACLEVKGLISPLRGCQNFTFHPADCACDPKHRTSCAACAEISDLGCVWANLTTNVTIAVDGHSASLPLFSRASCQAGDGIVGPGARAQNLTWKFLGQRFSIALVSEPTSFYWLQCDVQGISFAASVAASSALALCLLCCLLTWLCRKCGGSTSSPQQPRELLNEGDQRAKRRGDGDSVDPNQGL